ncbi:MAG: ATPase, T2SS/T4P/T4SS family [Planctomycetota bacterium]
MDETRLGSILLESRVISEADLEKCLEIQALTGNNRPVGQILIEQGLLDRGTLDRLLQLQQARMAERVVSEDVDTQGGFLAAAVRAGARELVISEGRPVLARAAMDWRMLTVEPVRGPEVWDFVRTEMGAQVLEELADRHFVVRDLHREGLCRGRVTALRHSDGVAVLVELRPEHTPTAVELGIPKELPELLAGPRGLVLFVGERGIGRTELLAGVLTEMAREENRYLVVLDDAIDTALPAGGALIARRRVGEHVSSYASGLRTAVREDPDAILVGSLSSPDAFDMAVRAAEGGRLVVGWLDAGSVVGCLQRVLNFYPVYDVQRLRQSLATVLRAVCVRHLLSSQDGSRMVPATELLLVDEAARDVIRGGDLNNLGLLMRTEGGKNGHSLDQCMFELIQDNAIRMEDAYARAEEKAWLLERLRHPQDGVVN